MSTRVVSKTINLEAAPEQVVEKYITRIDEHGIKIHPEDWQTNSNYLQLNGDGVYIKDSNQVELAKFTADVLYPNLTISTETRQPIGKYGLLRKSFLKEHKPDLYQSMLLTGKLDVHLAEIDQDAQMRLQTVLRS